MLICWDQWFPEAARLTALTGADILFYPTAIGWHEHERPEVRHAQHEAWELVQRSHAVTNGVFVAAANRVGRDVTFWVRPLWLPRMANCWHGRPIMRKRSSWRPVI